MRVFLLACFPQTFTDAAIVFFTPFLHSGRRDWIGLIDV